MYSVTDTYIFLSSETSEHSGEKRKKHTIINKYLFIKSLPKVKIVPKRGQKIKAQIKKQSFLFTTVCPSTF